jgi:3-oxoacyl-[acyl-carrier-protein] synthase I
MQIADVSVVSWGARTPLGYTAPPSAAAVRAGIAGFQEHPYIVDSAGQPMVTAHAPYVTAVKHRERLLELLVPAIEEALAPLQLKKSISHPIALSLALPPPRAGHPSFAAEISVLLRQQVKGLASVTCFEVGHAAGALALQHALQQMGASPSGLHLVAGVDSYIDADTLEWLESQEQLHNAGPEGNPWGFIPGEAAGCLLLATGKAAEHYQMPSRCKLLSLGIGNEQNRIKTDTVCIGKGLSDAFAQTLEHLPKDCKVAQVICDQNGEAYRADEYGFTILRHGERFRAGSDFQAPADCWGDVGAASLPLFIILTAEARERAYSLGKHYLLWASSESGERGAVLVELPDHGKKVT